MENIYLTICTCLRSTEHKYCLLLPQLHTTSRAHVTIYRLPCAHSPLSSRVNYSHRAQIYIYICVQECMFDGADGIRRSSLDLDFSDIDRVFGVKLCAARANYCAPRRGAFSPVPSYVCVRFILPRYTISAQHLVRASVSGADVEVTKSEV